MAHWNSSSEGALNWFHQLFGPTEDGVEDVQEHVEVEDEALESESEEESPQEYNENAVELSVGLERAVQRRWLVAEHDEYAEMGAAAYVEPAFGEVVLPYESDGENEVEPTDSDIGQMKIAYINDAGIVVNLVPSTNDAQSASDAEPAASAAEPVVADAGIFREGKEGGYMVVEGRNSLHGRIDGRGHGVGRGRGRVANAWRPGEPLQEVYHRDEDIPAPFIEAQAAATARALKHGHAHGQGLDRGRHGELGNDVVLQQPSNAAEPRNGGEHSDPVLDINGDIEDFNSDVLAEAAPFLLSNDPKVCNFNWQPMDSFHSQPEEFVPTQTGPTQHFDNAYDAFRAVWTDDILDQIALETNRHASQHTPNENYVPTNRHEILILFTFHMLLGLIPYPTINSCFNRMVLYRNNKFSALLSRSRYYWLNRHLHFADNLTLNKTSRLFKILPLIDHLNRVFKNLYIPKQNIAIVESLTLWKGMLNFRRYIPFKRARFGIKTFELCCSATGYLWSFFVYSGSVSPSFGDQSNLRCPQVVSTVLSLIRPLLNQGYRLWMDSWFNSPSLARYLKRNGTDCCGTLRINRLHVPRHVTTVPLQVGQFTARHAQDISILSWKDKRRVTMISTFHGSEQMRKFYGPELEIATDGSRVNLFKPTSVRDYNNCMGGVHRKDQTLEPYLVERRRCRKWFLKLFKRLLNVTVLNSRILVEGSTGRSLCQRIFQEQLILDIVKRHFNETPTVRRHAVTIHEPLTANRRYDLTLGHFAAPLTLTDLRCTVGPFEQPATYDMTRPNKRKTKTIDDGSTPKQKCIRKICTYCHDQDKKTNHKTTQKCIVCGVPLCAYPCFQLYHTKRKGHPAPCMIQLESQFIYKGPGTSQIARLDEAPQVN